MVATAKAEGRSLYTNSTEFRLGVPRLLREAGRRRTLGGDLTQAIGALVELGFERSPERGGFVRRTQVRFRELALRAWGSEECADLKDGGERQAKRVIALAKQIGLVTTRRTMPVTIELTEATLEMLGSRLRFLAVESGPNCPDSRDPAVPTRHPSHIYAPDAPVFRPTGGGDAPSEGELEETEEGHASQPDGASLDQPKTTPEGWPPSELVPGAAGLPDPIRTASPPEKPQGPTGSDDDAEGVDAEERQRAAIVAEQSAREAEARRRKVEEADADPLRPMEVPAESWALEADELRELFAAADIQTTKRLGGDALAGAFQAAHKAQRSGDLFARDDAAAKLDAPGAIARDALELFQAEETARAKKAATSLHNHLARQVREALALAFGEDAKALNSPLSSSTRGAIIGAMVKRVKGSEGPHAAMDIELEDLRVKAGTISTASDPDEMAFRLLVHGAKAPEPEAAPESETPAERLWRVECAPHQSKRRAAEKPDEALTVQNALQKHLAHLRMDSSSWAPEEREDSERVLGGVLRALHDKARKKATGNAGHLFLGMLHGPKLGELVRDASSALMAAHVAAEFAAAEGGAA